jgi:hypothetical protein
MPNGFFNGFLLAKAEQTMHNLLCGSLRMPVTSDELVRARMEMPISAELPASCHQTAIGPAPQAIVLPDWMPSIKAAGSPFRYWPACVRRSEPLHHTNSRD